MLRSRVERLERRHGARHDRPCTCPLPIVERLLGETEPEPAPDTRTHCERCGGRLPMIRVVEVVLPPVEAVLATLAEATGIETAEEMVRFLDGGDANNDSE